MKEQATRNNEINIKKVFLFFLAVRILYYTESHIIFFCSPKIEAILIFKTSIKFIQLQ